jgi:hypothetical protein
MKPQLGSIIAKDENVAIKIDITATPDKGCELTESELDELVRKLLRQLAASALPNLPYTDFGAENIQVVI